MDRFVIKNPTAGSSKSLKDTNKGPRMKQATITSLKVKYFISIKFHFRMAFFG